MAILTIVEDHVVPQLLTSAIEAYEFEHRAFEKGGAKTEIETYGLLWGYSLPARNGQEARIVATIATTETSALRHEDWVMPNFDSIKTKRDFFSQYWPHLELVGTFHSHPYPDRSTVADLKGWRASPGDLEHWPQVHEELRPDLPEMMHLIITITALQKKGTAWPTRLLGNEQATGYVLSSDWRKIWIKGYCTLRDEDEAGTYSYESKTDVNLDIPSLTHRFSG